VNEIPQSFKEGVFNHVLIYSTQPESENTPLAIYEKSDNGKPRGFEVVRFQLRKSESVTVKGIRYDYEDRLVYPSNEQWGTHGFSCVSRQAAEIRLQTMIAEGIKRNSSADKVPTTPDTTAP